MNLYFSSIKQYSWITLICTLLATIAGFYLARSLPAVVQVSSIMFVNADAPGTSIYPSQASTNSIDKATNYTSLIMSRSVMEFVYQSDSQIKEHGYSVNDLLVHVIATSSTTTSAITITATATSANNAILLANDVAKGFESYIQRQSQERLDAIRGDLQNRLAAYQRQSNRSNSSHDIEVLQSQLLALPSTVQSDVYVIQMATAADVIPATKTSLILAITTSVGLLLGTALMVITIFLDNRLRSEEQVKEKLEFAYLGSIPNNKQIETNLTQPIGSMKQDFIDICANLRLTGVVPGRWHAPQGAVLLVTSAQAVEGKTTVAIALATTLARKGSSVVVVDGNLRHPTTHLAFGMSTAGCGLSGLLKAMGGVTVDAAMQRTNFPGIWLLPAGPAMDDPTLLFEQELPAILARLREKIDLIIIDAPSLLSGADASLMATMVDGIVLVVDSRYSKLPLLLRAKEILISLTYKPIGVVMNRFPGRRYNRYYVASLESSNTRTEKWGAVQAPPSDGRKPEPTHTLLWSKSLSGVARLPASHLTPASKDGLHTPQ